MSRFRLLEEPCASGSANAKLRLPDPGLSWYAERMDAQYFVRRTASLAFFWGTAFASGALTTGCNQEEAKAESRVETLAEKATVPVIEAQDKPPEPVELSGKPEYKEEAFTLALKAPSAVKAGVPLEFTVILTAAGGYKINQEYPIKFQFAEAKGVTPKKQTVRKEDAKLDKSSATLPLSVTIEGSGQHSISGKLSFSVCTDERCLIEKRDLKVEVTVP